MSQTQSELLNLHTNTESQNTNSQQSNSQLIEIERVTNTPFDIVTTDQGTFVSVGKFRLTELKETKQECREMIHNKDWDVIIGLIHAFILTADQIVLDEKTTLTLKDYQQQNNVD